MKITKILPFTVMSLCLFGCDRPEKTIDNLRQEVTSFRTAPDDRKYVAIEKELAKLDAQILKLRNQGEQDRATLLQGQRDSLAADFGAAKVHRTLEDAKSALKGIQDVIQKTGDNLPENSSEPAAAAPAPSEAPPAYEEAKNREVAAPETMTAPEPSVVQ